MRTVGTNQGNQRLSHGAASIAIALCGAARHLALQLESGETNGVGICSGNSCVRGRGVYRLVDVPEEQKTETTDAA